MDFLLFKSIHSSTNQKFENCAKNLGKTRGKVSQSEVVKISVKSRLLKNVTGWHSGFRFFDFEIVNNIVLRFLDYFLSCGLWTLDASYVDEELVVVPVGASSGPQRIRGED